MSTDDDEIPAAHSMDTAWFGVDDAGHVALFWTNENGPMPADAYSADGLLGELLGRRDEYDDEDYLTEAELAEVQDEGSARWRTVRIVEGEEDRWDEPYRRRHPAALGLFVFDQLDWGGGAPYTRTVRPLEPVHLEWLPDVVRERCVRLPGARFAHQTHLAPSRHVWCRWYGGEEYGPDEPVRDDPPRPPPVPHVDRGGASGLRDRLRAQASHLAERFMRPTRARRAEARAAVAGVESARVAWETLAARGVIPLEWAEDAARRFACTALEWRIALQGGESAPREETMSLAWPPTVEACVALASDVAGVTTAEALARQAAHARGIANAASAPLYWRVLDGDVVRAWRDGVNFERIVRSDAELDLLALGYALDPAFDDAIVLLAPTDEP